MYNQPVIQLNIDQVLCIIDVLAWGADHIFSSEHSHQVPRANVQNKKHDSLDLKFNPYVPIDTRLWCVLSTNIK